MSKTTCYFELEGALAYWLLVRRQGFWHRSRLKSLLGTWRRAMYLFVWRPNDLSLLVLNRGMDKKKCRGGRGTPKQ